MTDRTIDQVLAGCVRYWESTGGPADAVAEMSAELQVHLADAGEAGKPVDSVVGTDLNAFAEEWAAIYRGSPQGADPATPSSSSSTWILLTIGVLGVAFALIAILAPKGDAVDAEQWRWIWIGAAIVLGTVE